MIKLGKWLRPSRAVKESLDNLPSGVCVFSKNGLVVLSNYQMSRLIFAMTGRDLQSADELRQMLTMSRTPTGAVRDGSCFLLPDGSAWSFSLNQITDRDGNRYTEAIAADVTELREKQKLLTGANEAKRQTIAALEQIQQNVVAITREEEILAMKMRLHNEFGYNLQTIRKFLQNGCPATEKTAFLAKQREMLRKMRGELGNNDEIDPLAELEQLAAALDMNVIFTGEKPKQANVRELLSCAVRECLTNTLRHANGNRVFAELVYSPDALTATFTNNGQPPKAEITEGGGLTSLRTRIENAGGTMTVHGLPQFFLTVTIPMKGEATP